MSDKITYKTIWDTLSAIDCSDKVEKKMDLTYLSWAWAWGIIQEHFADATYNFYVQPETKVPYVQYPDGTAEVICKVQIGDCSREMWLPVMDYKNNAIANPNSRQVSDTKMRCLVKCLAMFGLGHYIFAGEDLPREEVKEETKAKPKAEPKKEVKPVAEEKPVKKDTVDWKVDGTLDGANLVKDGLLAILDALQDKDSVSGQWKAWSESEDGKFMKEKFTDVYKEMRQAFIDKLDVFVKGGNNDAETTN